MTRDSEPAGHAAAPPAARKLRRARAAHLVRYILTSDEHGFVSRIYGLSIIAYHFENYDDLAKHPDCKYAIDVNYDLTVLVRRVESLNMAGDLLWPDVLPANFKDFPVSRHQWLTVASDVFLMRYISVVDCALILANAVYEAGLDPKKCSLDNLRKRGVLASTIAILAEMLDDQGTLRRERNERFHHGAERGYTDDDQTFRLAALFEHRSGGMTGTDQYGRKINLERSMNEGLVELQREFNRSTRRLVRQLDRLYDVLSTEFEQRFGPYIRASSHGLRVSRRG